MHLHPANSDQRPALSADDAAAIAMAEHISAVANAVFRVPAEDVVETAAALVIIAKVMVADDPGSRTVLARQLLRAARDLDADVFQLPRLA